MSRPMAVTRRRKPLPPPRLPLRGPKVARIAQKAAARSGSFGQVNATPYCSTEATRAKRPVHKGRGGGFRQHLYGMTRTVTREVFVALSLTISVRMIA
jgi:hypothetical protein